MKDVINNIFRLCQLNRSPHYVKYISLLKTKYTLSSCCSLFKDICAKFQYEGIWISLGKLNGLATVLELNVRLRRFVKRAMHYDTRFSMDDEKDLQSIPGNYLFRIISSLLRKLPVEACNPNRTSKKHSYLSEDGSVNNQHLQRINWLHLSPIPGFSWNSTSLSSLTIDPRLLIEQPVHLTKLITLRIFS